MSNRSAVKPILLYQYFAGKSVTPWLTGHSSWFEIVGFVVRNTQNSCIYMPHIIPLIIVSCCAKHSSLCFMLDFGNESSFTINIEPSSRKHKEGLSFMAS